MKTSSQTITKAFIESLEGSIGSRRTDWFDFFRSPGELIVTRAPGRLDLMGGIADYSGSLSSAGANAFGSLRVARDGDFL
ncbi:MAG TPA: hypothetical protein VE863_12690 [Pyrinomonadaceae bacterium]|nr:hypothetical protein [Pyrinomonadaceae bacterium]